MNWERAAFEEVEGLARAALGDADFVAAFAATQGSSLREALELGLSA
jgi:hypothetical protein